VKPKKRTAETEEDDDDYIDEEVEIFGRHNFGKASPYFTPYDMIKVF
jgi:hypothetical protein